MSIYSTRPDASTSRSFGSGSPFWDPRRTYGLSHEDTPRTNDYPAPDVQGRIPPTRRSGAGPRAITGRDYGMAFAPAADRGGRASTARYGRRRAPFSAAVMGDFWAERPFGRGRMSRIWPCATSGTSPVGRAEPSRRRILRLGAGTTGRHDNAPRAVVRLHRLANSRTLRGAPNVKPLVGWPSNPHGTPRQWRSQGRAQAISHHPPRLR